MLATPSLGKRAKFETKFVDVPLVEFMYLVFTRMPYESYRRRLWSLLLYLCYVFRALIYPLVCWLKFETIKSTFASFMWAHERISTKMHSTGIGFVTGPSNILLSGVYVYTFSPETLHARTVHVRTFRLLGAT